MPNPPTIINGQLIFQGSIAGQVAVQAQPIAGNNLIFNLPNTIPNPNAVLSVIAVTGSTVTFGFAPPAPQSFNFSQITGTIATSQLGSVEGNGSLVQLTNGSAAPSATLAHFGISANYAVLATAGITNSGSTVIAGGDIGSNPTVSITGFPPGAFVPPAAIDNADAAAALVAANAAYTYFAGLTFTSLSGSSVDLSTAGVGSTNRYIPGNYSAGTTMAMSTGIVLDAQGDPTAQFVFKAGSTVNLASNQSVTLINGADPANVVWLVGTAFTSVAPSTMVGNILAVSAITLGGGTLNGRAFTITAGPVTISTATAITASAGAGVIAAGDVVIYDAFGNIKSSGILLSSLGGAAGVLSVNGLSGAVTLTTTNIAEGSNLYYTTGRVDTEIDAHIGVKNAANGFAGLDGSSHLTVVPASSAPANQFANAISASGALSYAQPSFANLSGSIATGQIPASTVTVAQLASVEGTGSKVQLTSQGATVSGDVVTYDGAGNVQDSGTLLSALATQSFVTSQGYITAAGTATTISGSITESQVTGLTAALATIAPLYDGAGNAPALAGDNHIASGTATLTTGSVTITLTGVSVYSASGVYYVQVTRTSTPGGAANGILWVTNTDGANFVIHSTDGTDSTSTVAWTAVGY
jgi:hypothetical protein